MLLHFTSGKLYAMMRLYLTNGKFLADRLRGGEWMRDWLMKARKEKGLTQLEVAKQLNISESYYCFIENGDRQKKMDIVVAYKLSLIFGIPIERILEFERIETG